MPELQKNTFPLDLAIGFISKKTGIMGRFCVIKEHLRSQAVVEQVDAI